MKISKKVRMLQVLAGVFYVVLAAVTVSFAFMLQIAVDFAGEGNLRGLLITLLVILSVVLPMEFGTTVLAFRCRMGFVRNMLLTVKQHRVSFLFSRRAKAPAEDDNKDLSFFTADADILESSYFSNIARMPLHIATFVFALGALLWINWVVTLVAIGVSLLPMLSSAVFAGGLARRKKAYSDAAANYVDTVRECIQGKKEIIAYDKQGIFLDKHSAENHKVEAARLKSNALELLAMNASGSLGGLVQIAVMGLSSYFVITGDMTFGFMIAVVQLMNSLLNPIHSLTQEINAINSAKAIIAKAKETAEPEPRKDNISEFNNAIEITGLALRYTEDEYVVRGLNLKFKRGGKYAVFAPSGYGKTSIARALAMEFAEFDGAITIDGRDIRDIDRRDYNKILRYVRQDPYLFSDTALNNLAFFDEIPDKARLEEVLRVTRVNEFLPGGEALSRRISNTSGLSGGQKQRIVLARALLHNPKVLVLDEITSGVDLDTACNILSELFQDKDLTCIAITHESDERFQSLFDETIHLKELA